MPSKYPEKTLRGASRATLNQTSMALNNEEFDFQVTTFDKDCEFGILLRGNHTPSDEQLVKIRALEAHLAAEIPKLENQVSEVKGKILQMEKRITTVGNLIASLQRKYVLQKEADHAGDPLLYDMILEGVNLTVQLEQTITTTYGKISSIQDTLKESCRRMLCSAALLAPIRLLPPELMSEIFILYVGPDVDNNGHSTGIQRSPLLVCHISSAWRSIALSTPQLWTHLSVPRRLTFCSFVELAESWFGRVGDLPLSLSLMHSIRKIDSANLGKLTIGLQGLWPCIRRLDINFDLNQSMFPLLGTIFRSASRLQILTLPIQLGTKLPEFSSYFTEMCDLRDLTLTLGSFGNVTRMRGEAFLSAFPWSQLTRLSMEEIPVEFKIWRTLMQECRDSLGHGSFKLSSSRALHTAHVIRHPIISFPKMISLQIHLEGYGSWAILRDLYFPSLRALELGGNFASGSGGNVRDFGNIGASNLETITLSRGIFKAEDLVNFLRHYPNLQSFTGTDLNTNYNPFIACLSAPASATQFLPRLKSLSLQHWHRDSGKIDKTAWLRMLEARFQSQNEGGSTPSVRSLIAVSIDANFLSKKN